MSARLKKSFGWYTGLVYQGEFMVNHWNIELDLLTVSDDSEQQNIAYDRMKYFMQHVMDDSILIGVDDPALDRYLKTQARVIVLPDEPVDQIVGIMLYLKLNAIMENRLIVTCTEIWSTQGDQTSYLHIAGESVGDLLGQDGWWVDSRPTWSDARPKTDSKVVNLELAAEWKDRGLAWDRADGKESNSVVFARFDRNEDK